MSGNVSDKLLSRAKASPFGWTRKELIRLYKSFGFGIYAGEKHDLAKHPSLPDGIKSTISRISNELHPDYVRTAVKIIEMVLSKEK